MNHTACDNMDELKRKVEALLFSSGKYIKLDELAKLCRANSLDVQKAVAELVNDYASASSSLMVVSDKDSWKLTVREPFVHVVRNVVAETELTKTVMETLAVVAWKAPVLQSDIIKVRTNKAYDHIAELESQGFIAKKKHGRTYRIDLAQKFFDYFDVKSRDEVKNKFNRFDKLVEEKHELTAKDLLDLLPKPYAVDRITTAASRPPQANSQQPIAAESTLSPPATYNQLPTASREQQANSQQLTAASSKKEVKNDDASSSVPKV